MLQSFFSVKDKIKMHVNYVLLDQCYTFMVMLFVYVQNQV